MNEATTTLTRAGTASSLPLLISKTIRSNEIPRSLCNNRFLSGFQLKSF